MTLATVDSETTLVDLWHCAWEFKNESFDKLSWIVFNSGSRTAKLWVHRQAIHAHRVSKCKRIQIQLQQGKRIVESVNVTQSSLPACKDWPTICFDWISVWLELAETFRVKRMSTASKMRPGNKGMIEAVTILFSAFEAAGCWDSEIWLKNATASSPTEVRSSHPAQLAYLMLQVRDEYCL